MLFLPHTVNLFLVMEIIKSRAFLLPICVDLCGIPLAVGSLRHGQAIAMIVYIFKPFLQGGASVPSSL